MRTNSLFQQKYGLGDPWRFTVLICAFGLCVAFGASNVSAVAEEFTGKFEPKLAPNKEDLDHVIFKPFRDLSKVQFAKRPEGDAAITAGRLYHPPTDKAAILALLVEPDGEPPYVYADVDLNNVMDANEKFDLSNDESGNPYIWQTTINVPLKEGFFQSFPVFVQYFKNVEMDEMGKDDRLVLHSTKAFARGYVDIQGKKTLVQYDHNPRNKKIKLPQVKIWLEKNELAWTQATLDSIREVIRNYRVHSYPTTLLIDPEGKIISLNQTKKGQPSLRGQDLLKSLDRLLPH